LSARCSDLIDELRLLVHPVVLGGGKRLFDGDAAMKTMALVDAKPFATGTVVLTYRPAPPPTS
jgi:dihydrofolate reductase